ncbi:MAG: DUF2007 domain-containing protein [Beijerinckiaceae bacterium]|nr:DUF2007 domain-containing protein [Beijerinckiaceae bacterium]
MIELMRTNNLVTISAAEAILTAGGVHVLVLDGYISALEGGIGAFQRRVMVVDDEEQEARTLLIEAGLGAELRDAGRR